MTGGDIYEVKNAGVKVCPGLYRLEMAVVEIGIAIVIVGNRQVLHNLNLWLIDYDSSLYNWKYAEVCSFMGCLKLNCIPFNNKLNIYMLKV